MKKLLLSSLSVGLLGCVVYAASLSNTRFRFSAPSVIYCPNSDYVTIRYAISRIATNGTVYVPSGKSYYTNTIAIDKPMNLIGAGTNSTMLVNAVPATTNAPDYFPWGHSYEGSGVQYPPIILIRSSGVKVANLFFQCATQQDGVVTNRGAAILVSNTVDLTNNVSFSKGVPLTGINICSNLFNQAYYHALKACGVVSWITHHNEFIDCNLCWGNIQGDSAGWKYHGSSKYTNTMVFNTEQNPMLTLGTAIPPFFEYNFVHYTTWLTNYPKTAVYSDCGNGGSQVIRYNCYSNNTANSYPYNMYGVQGWDIHGNANYESNSVFGDNRGSVLSEIYGNTNYCNHNDYQIVDCRGGTVMLHDNILYSDDQCSYIKKREEETGVQNGYSVYSTTPNHTGPFQDNLFLYEWNNSWRWVGAYTNSWQEPFPTSWATNAIKMGVNWFTNSPSIVTGSQHSAYAILGSHPLDIIP